MTIAIADERTVIKDTSQMLDFMASASYTTQSDNLGIVFQKQSLPESFFDLKTRLAGEILQKFSNYRVKLAIVGDFDGYSSKALADFIRECNRGNQVFFVSDIDTAIAKMEGC